MELFYCNICIGISPIILKFSQEHCRKFDLNLKLKFMAYTFDGKEGSPIDLSTAKTMVNNYKAKMKDPNETVAHFFGFEIIQKILMQPGCMGIRIYYGLGDNCEKQLLLVGADKNGNNMLPRANVTGNALMAEQNTVGDVSYPCPSYCPDNSL